MKQAINIRIDKDLVSLLDRVAKEMDLTRTTLIERAILAYQDKLDEMIADKRLEEIYAGKAEVVSLKEFMKSAGLDNV